MTPERYRQIGQVYRAALELPPEQQAIFLAEACGDDRELHQDVDSLLAHQSRGDDWIDGRALEIAARGLAVNQMRSWKGCQVDHYQILSLLGTGGMGVVYRARDARLGRDVAIKVLPVAYSSNPEWLRRFEQEARAAGQLNHPNVLTVYDVGVHEGTPYIVAELLEGEELRALLKHGPVPERQAMDIARQVASGLAAAHGKGIVHRDLKPENIFITTDGRAKILDFGIAKLKTLAGGSSEEQASPLGTAASTVMGTVGYMPPEQVLGHETDSRVDIFALGVILYEVMSGRRPFSGESAVEVLHAVLTEDPPDLSEANPKLSVVLAKIVRRCLEKKPEQRFQSTSDLSFVLEALSPAATASVLAVKTAAAPAPRRRLLLLASILALVVVVARLGWHLDRTDYWWRNPLANATLTPVTDSPGTEGDAAISREGKFVAFLSDQDGPFDVWVGQIGAGDFKNLTKGQVADMKNPEVRSLGFSPDGSHIFFWVRDKNQVTTQWTVPTMGGKLRLHLKGPELAWSPDGTRMVYHTNADGDPLFVTEPSEEVGKQIYAAERGVHCHFPLWSPDAAFIYFVQGFPPDEMDIWRIRPAGGSPERITSHNSRVAYPTFLDEQTMLYTSREADGSGPWLYGIDVERRVPHRLMLGSEQYTSIAATPDGRRLVATVANPETNLSRVPILKGMVDESCASRVPLRAGRVLSPRIGPNYMLYLSSKGGEDGIWKLLDETPVELWRGSFGRVLPGPTIAPDGSRIAFAAQKGGRLKLYLMDSEGTSTSVIELAASLNVRGAPAWHPAGKWLTVPADQGKGTEGLFKVPLDGSPPVQLVGERAMNPVWSPDGSFLVYSGVEVGTVFPLKAVTVDGRPHVIPEINLSRGANRFLFLPGRPILVVQKGEFWHKNFWSIDLETSQQRQLTNFGPEFLIGDFDISADGKEIIFGRLKENSRVIMIDLPQP